MRSLVLLVLLGATLPVLGADEPRLNGHLLVPVTWLSIHLGDPELKVVHVGENDEGYRREHLPGARFLPWSAVAVTRDGVENELPSIGELVETFTKLGIGDSGRVVIYGERRGLMAARAFVALDYLGHGDRVALLDGGLEAWHAGGRRTTNLAYRPSAAPFNPRLELQRVVARQQVADASWALLNLAEPRVRLLDARPADEFTGEKPGANVPRGGHIPGARNLYWEELLASKERPVLKPEAELRRLFGGVGIRPGDTVISYCRTGGQASFDYFVARYLGFDIRLYDGSFSDWSKAEGTPVATGS